VRDRTRDTNETLDYQFLLSVALDDARDDRRPAPEEVEAARTPAGGWTKTQLAQWGVPWLPPQGWKQRLERKWREAAGLDR
jgi:hypothetical protein